MIADLGQREDSMHLAVLTVELDALDFEAEAESEGECESDGDDSAESAAESENVQSASEVRCDVGTAA